MKKEKFDIQGMTCSSCQSHVEKAVSNLDGIIKVNVNLLSNNMNQLIFFVQGSSKFLVNEETNDQRLIPFYS